MANNDVLEEIKSCRWYKSIETNYSITEIEKFANDLVKGCEFAINNKLRIVSSGD